MAILLMTILTTFFACNKAEEQEQAATTEILYTLPEESETNKYSWLCSINYYDSCCGNFNLSAIFRQMTTNKGGILK